MRRLADGILLLRQYAGTRRAGEDGSSLLDYIKKPCGNEVEDGKANWVYGI